MAHVSTQQTNETHLVELGGTGFTHLNRNVYTHRLTTSADSFSSSPDSQACDHCRIKKKTIKTCGKTGDVLPEPSKAAIFLRGLETV